MTHEANTRLADAAPDLLRALKDALDGLKNPDAHPMAQAARIKSARAAIAKAAGDAA